MIVEVNLYHVQSIKYNDFVEVRNNMNQEKCNIKQGKSDIKPKLPKDYTK